MVENTTVQLKDTIQIHNELSKYRDERYINLIRQINSKTKDILTDDMGSQFISNCGRDIAGEVVRNYFNTSSFYITVDQMAMRILKFDYKNEYDPLSENGGMGEIRKNIYNYNLTDQELDKLTETMDGFQKQLFNEHRKTDARDIKGKRNYRESQMTADGKLFDELTGKEGKYVEFEQNGKKILKSELHADHIQSREAAKFNERYLSEKGIYELKEFWNSPDNMQLIHASANTSKGDVRICMVNGKIEYRNPKESDYDPSTDIAHRATPEQLTQAVVDQWLKETRSNDKIQKLKDTGYIVENEDGTLTVPKSVQKKLEASIRHSQNVESVTILKNTKYDHVFKDAGRDTAKSIGKIIAGQIIYYAAPPLVYEIKHLIKDRKNNLDSVLEKLKTSAKRIGDYVLSKIKDIFKNVLFNSLKEFVKTFMSMLIGTVTATIKKLLKIAKNLVLSTVDAVRVIVDKNTSPAEKADSVVKLFGTTITSCVIEVIFDLLSESLHLPEQISDLVFSPLQILATVVCTNLTMLILEKADLFDVRFGFKINSIKKVFEEERQAYIADIEFASQQAEIKIDEILSMAKTECRNIYNNLQEIDPHKDSVRGQLESINSMFSMNINYEDKWLTFLGVPKLEHS